MPDKSIEYEMVNFKKRQNYLLANKKYWESAV